MCEHTKTKGHELINMYILLTAHCSHPSHHNTEYHTNDDIPLTTITNEGNYTQSLMTTTQFGHISNTDRKV